MDSKKPQDVSSTKRLPALTIYEVVQREGEEELARPIASLWWSGLAAGIAISASLLTQGALEVALPDTGFGPALVYAGYCVGFLIVILGRLQLFTENTITPVLPIMADFSWRRLGTMAKLWAIVLTANLVGTFVAALFTNLLPVVPADQLSALHEIARHAVLDKTPWEVLVAAVPAGFVVAAIVWLMPSSKGSEFWVIVALTYVIAIAEFSHVIVGSAEAFLLQIDGQISMSAAVGGFILPALVGNVIGGSALFSILAYAQVRDEIE